MFHHPTRAGTRGGQGLFKWEDVKEDKYRENYLGHSLNAPVGRWQKNKDLLWYGREAEKTQTREDKIASELEEIRANEAEALAEALGYAGPKRRRTDGNAVSKQEIQSLVKKDFADDEETAVVNVEEMKGLGFQSAKSRIAAIGIQAVKEIDEGDGDHIMQRESGVPQKETAMSSGVTGNANPSHKPKKEKKAKKEKDKKKHKKKHKKEKERIHESSDDEGDTRVRETREQKVGADHAVQQWGAIGTAAAAGIGHMVVTMLTEEEGVHLHHHGMIITVRIVRR
ncbi:hypothetical protein SpCBS45565_g03002 [Spizellomyces sp. 'palustris']|nr:hypothetical protein SpCBS45565_g03002 [Spizellomyces sp. 'palustris']